MLISEFARTTKLTRDTVRFYVRLGLLRPQTTAKGGRRPYQVFTAEDVQTAKVIRTAQSLGMSLKEIAAMAKERRAGRMTRERSLQILRQQLETLEAKATQLHAFIAYLQAKISALEGNDAIPLPNFDEFLSHAT